MSEPPLKKKRTLLDFFDRTAKKFCPEKRETHSKGKKKMATPAVESSHESPEVTPGCSKECDIPEVVSAADSQAKENPGCSNESDVTETVPLADSQEIAGTESSMEMDSQDSMASSQSIPDRKPSQRRDGSTKWKGIPINMLNTLGNCMEDLGPLQNVDSALGSVIPHKVLFKTPFTYDGTTPPKPFPHFRDRWHEDYVRMPCSNCNEYPSLGKKGQKVVRRRWDMIQEALLEDIKGPYELEESILKYNSRYFGKWNFNVLHKFFVEVCEDEERNYFFNTILKKMVALALQLPYLCTTAIPLLKAGKKQSITLSQQQIACLLANAFFCTFPRRNSKAMKSEFSKYPGINFNSMFMGQPTEVMFEKLRCIINYFKRVCTKMPAGTVTFTRQTVEPSDWENDTTYLTGLHVSSEGTIEDDGDGLLQVDFANKFLGGGVLGHGCVQEEIRFLICPEMIVSRLFTEVLGDHECLIMKGCERFSNYDGYAGTFVWTENFEDKTPRDSWGRIQCEVVAIDALVVRDYRQQFQARQVKRELTKAYSGFKDLGGGSKSQLPAVCTGNWGCGAFGGDKHLKALIQMMAAAKARRDVCYFTFDDERLCNEMHNFHQYITVTNTLCIGDLMKLIEQYRRNKVVKSNGRPRMKLFEYILGVFDGSLEETADEDSSESLEMQYHKGSDGIEEGVDVANAMVEDEAAKAEQGDAGKATCSSRKNKNSSPGKPSNAAANGSEVLEDGEKSDLKKVESVDYKANTP